MAYGGMRCVIGQLSLGCTLLLGCSRTGLEFGETSTSIANGGQAAETAGGGQAAETAGGGSNVSETEGASPFEPDPPPDTSSRRWLALPTKSPSGAAELFAMRLGQTVVEDLVRIDPNEPGQTWAGGDFSPKARGFAVTTEANNTWRATRLVDFDANRPRFIEVPLADDGLFTRFGPWLDDHRIVTYETDAGGFGPLARNCRIIDLDAPQNAWSFPALGALGSSYMTYLDVSPSRGWLVQLVLNDTGDWSLLLARILNSGISAWTKVVDFGADGGPARLNFSGDEGYLVVETYSKSASTLNDRLYPIRLSDPPVALTPYDATPGDRHLYALLAPTGSRFFEYSYRMLADGNGTNPITVVDAESGAKVEVTPAHYSATSPGFTQDGLGILGYGYSYYEDHGMEWFGVTSEFVAAAAKPLVNGAGLGTRGGSWSPEGAWYAISGSNEGDFTTWTGPIDLERFDFNPGYAGPTHLARLSEYANVDNWHFAPDASSLVYRVAVTSDVLESTDPLTQGHYASELGTYWVALEVGSTPVALDFVWTDFDALTWLPDSQGLLRFGPVGTTKVVTDAQYGDGTSVKYASDSDKELDWLRLDGGKATALNLTPYLGSEHLLSREQDPILPDSWSANGL